MMEGRQGIPNTGMQGNIQGYQYTFFSWFCYLLGSSGMIDRHADMTIGMKRMLKSQNLYFIN